MRTHVSPDHQVHKAPIRNGDVDWDSFDTATYIADNYAELHSADREIISRLSGFYRELPPGSVQRSLELGAGPNLYPLMLAGCVSRHIEVVERSAANVTHLRNVFSQDPPPEHWQPFWRLSRELNPALPQDLRSVLDRVVCRQGNAFDLEPGLYGLGSMFFVAESVTSDENEFRTMCCRFVESVRPGGYVVAAFMAGMSEYGVAEEVLPSYPLSEDRLADVFGAYTERLQIRKIPPDASLPYQYDGMLLMTGHRSEYRGYWRHEESALTPPVVERRHNSRVALNGQRPGPDLTTHRKPTLAITEASDPGSPLP